MKKPSIEDYCDKLLNKLKQEPNYELMQELGLLLMKHINDLTPKERERYDELIKILGKNELDCLHDRCTECSGSGIKKDGGPCVHYISCPCPKCTPFY